MQEISDLASLYEFIMNVYDIRPMLNVWLIVLCLTLVKRLLDLHMLTKKTILPLYYQGLIADLCLTLMVDRRELGTG